jgi:hypothetical protein
MHIPFVPVAGTALRVAAHRASSSLRVAAALGAFLPTMVAQWLVSPEAQAQAQAQAQAFPLRDIPCATSTTSTVRTCGQAGAAGDVFAQAIPDDLSAGARLDGGPYSFVAHGALYYYLSIVSTGDPGHDRVRSVVTADATGAGAGFNVDVQSAGVRIASPSLFGACFGHICAPNRSASFMRSRTAWSQPYSWGSEMPDENPASRVAGATSNANDESFIANVDPIVVIDPDYLAANPGLVLTFSEGVPSVPLPASIWLMMGGTLGLFEVRRRQRAASLGTNDPRPG